MATLVHPFFPIVASVVLATSSCVSPHARCETTVGDRCQLPWQSITVHDVGMVPRSAVDSVITVRLDERDRIRVLYAFDNPCEYVVTAKTRQTNDTLDVYFATKRRGTPRMGVDSLPEVYGCPATIWNRGYEVIVGPSTRLAHTVRGFTSSGSVTTVRTIAAQ